MSDAEKVCSFFKKSNRKRPHARVRHEENRASEGNNHFR